MDKLKFAYDFVVGILSNLVEDNPRVAVAVIAGLAVVAGIAVLF